MSDHVVYAKPLLVTEEKLKEAREKQMKQRALREALDRQIAQSKMRKVDILPKKTNPSLENNKVEQIYTFSYENGHGQFIRRDESTESIGNPTKKIINSGKSTGMEVNQKKPTAPAPFQPHLYQSNSLPPNFAMSTSEANPLAPKKTEYNTNSLPVDIFKNNNNNNNNNNNSNKSKNNKPPLHVISPRILELFPHGASPQRSPVSGKSAVDCEYQSNCLPRGFTLEEARRQAQAPQRPPLSPRRPAPLSTPTRSPRTPRRPAGPLPPLESFEGIMIDPPAPVESGGGGGGGSPRLVRGKNPSAQRGRSNEGRARPAPPAIPPRNVQTRVTENKVERLQKELESRNFAMAKMREKERSWEEQVKQLKIELKNAKKKERDLNKLVNEGPRRAETAPDQPMVSPPVLSSPSTGGGIKKSIGAPSGFVLGKKQDFAKSRIFSNKAFRPISAPSDPISTSYVPIQTKALPPLQDSFKCASVLTRKTAFGLAEENANRPVPIEYEHLLQFVQEQIITQQQADALWRLFTNGASPLDLLRRQSAGFQPNDELVINQNDNYQNKNIVKHELKQISKQNIKRVPEEEELEEEDEELEEEVEGEGLEYEEEDEEFNNNNNNSTEEENSEERDTFETFAELHLQEYMSQEDPDEE